MQQVFAGDPVNFNKNFLLDLMHSKMPQFNYIYASPSKYRLQVIYTKIDRDSKNHPTLTTYTYRCIPDEFFSPASTVKLPLSLLVIERLQSIKSTGVTKDTRFSTDSNFQCQVPFRKDLMVADSIPTLSGCITKALVVSDNEAYNRLYEFLGQQEINHRMWELGFTNSRIIQRFSPCDTTANKHTNSFIFYDKAGAVIYRQTPRFNTEIFSTPLKNMVIGKGYLDDHNRMIMHGMDFSKRNYLPLYQIDDLLKRVIFPELYPENRQFKVGENMDFIRKLLALRPSETGIAAYSLKKDYWDTYTNYLFYGCDENATIPEHIRIFNIVGQSFGFLTDCAYYTDFRNRIEFFLSVTIYANSDEILNDGKYDYKSIGFPFMKQFGQVIFDYELHRQVKHKPDLTKLERLFRP